ncbi:MAG TPA: hypothetical protein VL003_12460 [Pusillimonas sp.]|uniref:hypothetical protein n=1 Tax=Pusillimonas sp. TaxID=3040095 RepID=UPI002D0062B6|nr:hypothetical protein [Pusillimonas sp.]HUH88842.1 hypothetical protein [Pusillimonas sp.]
MPNTKQQSDKSQTQQDDTQRESQKSHGTTQNRSKKEGHVSQIGSGQDQQSSRRNKTPTRP